MSVTIPTQSTVQAAARVPTIASPATDTEAGTVQGTACTAAIAITPYSYSAPASNKALAVYLEVAPTNYVALQVEPATNTEIATVLPSSVGTSED
ncbi:hypothetical protein CVT25_013690, partial [Psilocybe cyanescens]